MFLTQNELREASGYAHISKQKAWLNSYGIKYAVDRWGRPSVMRKEFELAFTSDSAPKADEPNLRHISA